MAVSRFRTTRTNSGHQRPGRLRAQVPAAAHGLVRAPQIQVPVLILEGSHDDGIRRQALLKLELALPDARRTRLPDGGHALHDRCAEQVAELVTGFLSAPSLHKT